MLRVGLATAAFAALHSALASVRVKEAAARQHRHGRELYRAAYNAHAVVAFGALVWFIARQPKRTLYRATGATAVMLRIGQSAGIVFAAAAARATGLGTLTGLDNVRALLANEPWRPAPAAQGPEMNPDGTLRIRGPFRAVRHPLNLAPVAPFWLTPHMTSRRLAFNLVATAYLVLGSVHEESRLRRQYGERYEAYQRGGTPFFVPRVRSLRSMPSSSTPAPLIRSAADE